MVKMKINSLQLSLKADHEPEKAESLLGKSLHNTKKADCSLTK